MNKVFYTGDTHGDMRDLKARLAQANVPEGSTVVVLGDVGLNYWLNGHDEKNKKMLDKLPYTFLFIHGNHEARPYEVEGYVRVEGAPGYADIYLQPDHANQIYLQDGIHMIDDKKVLVAAGAYSVDKFYRLATGKKWWESEQMPREQRDAMLVDVNGAHFDLVLTHTCPYLARPLEKGLSFIDQTKVDPSMEVFLERLRQQITFDRWLCGHWHIDEDRVDETRTKIEFLYQDLKP